jgi:calcineurin-like phosphoesterase family protein
MKTYITSDLHFGHTNIMKFCPGNRGHFRDVAHMNSEMIRLWNTVVEPEDLVYILGDVAFTNAQTAVGIMHSLNGRKILIQGNHDVKLIKDANFRQCFESVHDYLRLVYNKQQLVVMFHYPIWEWDQMHRGSIHFHGHLHGNPSNLEKYRARDVGYDATGKIVTLMEDAIASALRGEIRSHHEKN